MLTPDGVDRERQTPRRTIGAVTEPTARAPQLRRRWPLVLATAGLLVAVGVFAAYEFAASVLKKEVINGLGPSIEVGDVRLGLGTLVITGLRQRAPPGWPVESALKAATITVIPDLRELLSGEIYIEHLTIQDGYIAAVRPKQGGGLQILPGLVAARKVDSAASGQSTMHRTIRVSVINLQHCTVDLFDRSVLTPTRLHVEDVQGSIRDVVAPRRAGHSALNLTGAIVHGNDRGTIAVSGWIDVADKSSDLKAVVRNVDLVPFSPYVADKTKAGIGEGTFNIDLTASLRRDVVNAHGLLSVRKLALKTGNGPLAAFDALPQRAFLGALRDEQGTISLEFDLKGNLNDPTFSLTGGLGIRAAVAVLQGIGLGFEGLVRVFFSLFSGFAGALAG